MESISIGDAATLAMLIFTLVGFLVGGSWWASSISTKIDALDKKVNVALASHDNEHQQLWTAVRSVERDVVALKIRSGLGEAGS